MTTTTKSDLLAAGLDALAFSRRVTTGFLDNVPEDKYLYQPSDCCNHTLWVMGHLAHTDDYFITKLGGVARSVPESWDGIFGMNSKPNGDASQYPSIADARKAFDDRRAAIIAWFEGMSDADLSEELPEDLRSFAPTYAALMGTMAVHEGMHAGQIANVRRSLGLPLLFSSDG